MSQFYDERISASEAISPLPESNQLKSAAASNQSIAGKKM